MPAKLMPGRKASNASQSAAQASSDFVGQTKTIEKERCGEVRCAHERRERGRQKELSDWNESDKWSIVIGSPFTDIAK